MSALTVLILTMAMAGPAKAGLKPYGKNFFKSCWCQKQRLCQKIPENYLIYTDFKRGLQYQCQNCAPSQLTDRRSTTLPVLQIEKLAADKPRSCIRELSLAEPIK